MLIPLYSKPPTLYLASWCCLVTPLQAVASDGITEEVFLNKTSPTGRYWVAVYANGPADYVIR